MQWLTEGNGSVYTGMTSRTLLREFLKWLTARSASRGSSRSRPALILARILNALGVQAPPEVEMEDEEMEEEGEEDEDEDEDEEEGWVEGEEEEEEEGPSEAAGPSAGPPRPKSWTDPDFLIRESKAKALGVFGFTVHTALTRANAGRVEDAVQTLLQEKFKFGIYLHRSVAKGWTVEDKWSNTQHRLQRWSRTRGRG